MGDDSEWIKLPAEEKCTHKVFQLIFFLSFFSVNYALQNNFVTFEL